MEREQAGADRESEEIMTGIVVSSRVRLARNIMEYPFLNKMNAEQGKEVLNNIKNAALDSGSTEIGNLKFIDINRLNMLDKQALVEKHLISRDMLDGSKARGAVISSDEKISLLINEEDHIRIQCIFRGFQLDRAYQLCGKIDNMLEEKLNFAFNKDFGYLTCCPTNVGTGMRASVMLHLPALSMTGYIRKIIEACTKLGIAVRGIYGEHSEASGDMFQISNQVTLGQNENEIISNIKSVGSQIINQESALRKSLYEQSPSRFEDRICRSYGILKNARILTSEESFKLISDVRLGVYMGIIKDIDIAALDKLTLLVQPASLQKYSEKLLEADERDINRAETVKKILLQGG